MDPQTTVPRPPALHLGEIEIRPKPRGRRRVRSATPRKAVASHLHAWFRHAPGPVTAAYLDLAAAKIARAAPTLSISRSSPSAERTRISLDLHERMGATVLVVRDANPIALSRACLRALGGGRVLVATVDRIDRSPQQVPLPFLGRTVGFGAWAARIAARTGAPVVPGWVRTTRRGLVVEVGTPRVPANPEEGMRPCLDAFERWLLAGPRDGSFLADCRWRHGLAAAARSASGGTADA